MDFLVKPLSVDRLRKTVARLRSRIGETPAMLEPLLIELRETLEKRRRLRGSASSRAGSCASSPPRSILFFRSDQKYTAAVTREREHLVSRPLKQLVEELDPDAFWRVHRSYVVNLRAILSVRRMVGGGMEIVLLGTILSASR